MTKKKKEKKNCYKQSIRYQNPVNKYIPRKKVSGIAGTDDMVHLHNLIVMGCCIPTIHYRNTYKDLDDLRSTAMTQNEGR